MKKLLLLLLLITGTANAQTLTVSSPSLSLWGKTPAIMEMSVGYKDVGVHYFHVMEPYYLVRDAPFGMQYVAGQTTSNVGVSYSPINLFDIIRFGGMYFFKPFPVDIGERFNFLLDIGYNFRNFRISYSHISNGFGIPNEVNPGVDTIKLTVSL